MATRIKSPGTRLQLGASVLAAARVVDTTPVQSRLRRFEQVHRSYTTAQRKVDAAEAELRAGQARLAERDAVQDQAVETLACALATGGRSRVNPFDAFGAPAPGTLVRRPVAEEAAIIHQLVAAVLRSKDLNPSTKAAAETAEQAACVVEQAIVAVGKLQDAVRAARRSCDAIGQTWETAFAALRHGARAAADDGAPFLHATLFPPAKVVSKAKTEEPPVVGPEGTPSTTNAA